MSTYQSIPASLVNAGKAAAFQFWNLVASNFANHQSRLNALESARATVPPGMIVEYGGGTPPTGYLECNGQAVSRTTYQALFNEIGTAYGVGDGSTTFNVPDARGRAIMGSGTGSGLTARTIAQQVGTETETLDQTKIALHKHGINNPGHTHTWPNMATGAAGATTCWQYGTGAVAEEYTTLATTGLTINNSTGGGGSHNNMQPFIVVRFMIKT